MMIVDPYRFAAAGFAFVGGKVEAADANETISLTDLTGGASSSPAAGDVVIIAFGNQAASDLSGSVTGYTLAAELYSNDDTDANLFVYYKVLVGGDTSNLTLSTPFNGFAAIHVWRGIDGATPLDVAVQTATGVNTQQPNPPAITPITSGAVIIAMGTGGGLTDSDATPYVVSDLDNFFQVRAGGFECRGGIGSYLWETGSFDPAVWTGPAASDTLASWAAVTLALRPA